MGFVDCDIYIRVYTRINGFDDNAYSFIHEIRVRV